MAFVTLLKHFRIASAVGATKRLLGEIGEAGMAQREFLQGAIALLRRFGLTQGRGGF